jgi:hypothetical protein
LAALAGLPVAPLRLAACSSRTEPPSALLRSTWPVQTIFVVGSQTVGQAPADILQGCKRLGSLAETPLLGIEFDVMQDQDAWTFRTADPWPDLRAGGEALLDLLARALGNAHAVVT